MKKCSQIFSFFFIYFLYTTGFCQNDTPSGHFVKDSILREDGKIFFFKNINYIDYYTDKEKLLYIEKLYKKEKYEKAYDALYEYVMNFGVKNFYKDTYLLWRLGKLAQKLHYIRKAKAFYRLVLKHHRSGNDKQVRLFYDSLTRNDQAYFLPVEYYYNYANASSNIDTLDIPESIYTSMGDSVNSKFNDYAPTLSRNDLMMVFSSQRKQVRKGMRYIANEDLYYSHKADSLYISQSFEGSRIDTIPWTKARPLTGLNTEYNEGSACISKNQKTIYFSRCESPDGFGNCDLYVAFKQKDGTWGNVRNMGLNINSISWESHPALSHTEDTLFFASDRLGGFGMSDIYYSIKTSKYSIVGNDTVWVWTKAMNIGPDINTRYSEVSPFYHPKYPLLYFSSNGQLVNFGKFDIYKSYKYLGIWREPVNIGPLVNHKDDEYYFTIDSRARNLYYAKMIKIKDFDYQKGDTIQRNILNLHTATLPMEAQPQATAKFSGYVKDSITGKAVEGIISIIDLDDGIEVAPRYLRPDGSYQFDLIKGHNYLVIITGEDFFRVEKEFLLEGDMKLDIATESVKFKKWKFSAIEFKEASAQVTSGMEPDLNKLVMFLADNPHLALKISGHTDSSGDSDANMKLSQDRADSIKEYVLQKGKFKSSRVQAIGYGDTQPIIMEEKEEEDKRINRRVEFEIIKHNN